MIIREYGPPFGAKPQLLAERVARAEHHLAVQRLRILQLEADGFDVERPRALLQLMEDITEQFRIACRLFEVHQCPPLSVRLGVELRSVARPGQDWTHHTTGGPRPTSPADDLATFLCPHCGMRLAVKSGDDGALIYDINQWRRQCQHQSLQTPVLCQFFASSADMLH
jgi:hypothetical protein